jgi:hypothetical protein
MDRILLLVFIILHSTISNHTASLQELSKPRLLPLVPTDQNIIWNRGLIFYLLCPSCFVYIILIH